MSSPKNTTEDTNKIIERITPSRRRLREVQTQFARQMKPAIPQNISVNAAPIELRPAQESDAIKYWNEWFRFTTSETDTVLLMRTMEF
jgi:hypothetical protein